MKVSFAGYNCNTEFAKYSNGQLAIVLIDTFDHQCVAKASVNLDGVTPDEVAIRDYGENCGMLLALLEAGVVEPSHRSQHSGFVDIPICRLTAEAKEELTGE